MSTFNLHTTQTPQIWHIPGLSSVVAFFSIMASAFADAQQSMREASKKYPFAGL